MKNPFNFLFNKFSSEKDGSVIGVDVGSASMKVIQARKKGGRAILETYGELSIGPYGGVEVGKATRLNVDESVEALSDLFREANVTTRNSGVSIPMRQSMVSLLTLPTTNSEELKTMVPLEARKYIPVSLSEVALDWFAIPKREKDQDKAKSTEILSVAIHNDTLSQFSSIVQKANMETSFFEAELFSTVRSVVDVQESKPVMILDMGASTTKLYVVERGIIRDSHTINRGGQNMTENISRSLSISDDFAEEMKRNIGQNNAEQEQVISQVKDTFINPILSETNSMIVNYERKANKTISQIILVGGGVLLSGFYEKAENYFRINVKRGNPFAKVESPAFLDEVLDETGPGFATAIGLALRKLDEID